MHETSSLLYMSWITTFLRWKLCDIIQCLDYVAFLQRTLTFDLPVRAKSLADGRGSVFVHVALLLLFLEFTQWFGLYWLKCILSGVLIDVCGTQPARIPHGGWGGTPMSPQPILPHPNITAPPSIPQQISPPGPVSTRLALGQWPSENSSDIWALLPCTASSSQLPFLSHSSCLGNLEFLNSTRAPCSSGIWPTTQYSGQCPWALSLGTRRDHLARITVLTLPVV